METKHCPHCDSQRLQYVINIFEKRGTSKYYTGEVQCEYCSKNFKRKDIITRSWTEVNDRSKAEKEQEQKSLIQRILEYESDTFSANGTKVTETEAIEVAKKIIGSWINENLDGCIITEELMDIRNVSEQEELYN